MSPEAPRFRCASTWRSSPPRDSRRNGVRGSEVAGGGSQRSPPGSSFIFAFSSSAFTRATSPAWSAFHRRSVASSVALAFWKPVLTCADGRFSPPVTVRSSPLSVLRSPRSVSGAGPPSPTPAASGFGTAVWPTRSCAFASSAASAFTREVLPLAPEVASAIALRRAFTCATAPPAFCEASWIVRAIASWAAYAPSGAIERGSGATATGCVRLRPSTVSRTVYVPGGAHGPPPPKKPAAAGVSAAERPVQVPRPPVQAGGRAEHVGRRGPRRGHVHRGGVLATGLVRARVVANHRALRVEHVERDRAGVLRQVVVDDRARRRIVARREVHRVDVGRDGGRGRSSAALHQHGGIRPEEPRVRARHRGVELTERRDVVEHPERTPVRGDDQVVVPLVEITDRGHRQVELQRLPVVAVVERDVDAELGAGEEQPRADLVLANRVHVGAVRDPAVDLLPAPAAVLRAVDVRVEVVELVGVDGRVRLVWIRARRLDHRDHAHGFSPGGVTFVHVPHASVVTQISPSSVPAHTRPASMGEGAIV